MNPNKHNVEAYITFQNIDESIHSISGSISNKPSWRMENSGSKVFSQKLSQIRGKASNFDYKKALALAYLTRRSSKRTVNQCWCPSCQNIRIVTSFHNSHSNIWSYFLHLSDLISAKMLHKPVFMLTNSMNRAVEEYDAKVEKIRKEVKGWNFSKKLEPGSKAHRISTNAKNNSKSDNKKGEESNSKTTESTLISKPISVVEKFRQQFGLLKDIPEFDDTEFIYEKLETVLNEQDKQMREILKNNFEKLIIELISDSDKLSYIRPRLRQEMISKIKRHRFMIFDMRRLKSSIMSFLRQKLDEKRSGKLVTSIDGAIEHQNSIFEESSDFSETTSPLVEDRTEQSNYAIFADNELSKESLDVIRKTLASYTKFIEAMTCPIFRSFVAYFSILKSDKISKSSPQSMRASFEFVFQIDFYNVGFKNIRNFKKEQIIDIKQKYPLLFENTRMQRKRNTSSIHQRLIEIENLVRKSVLTHFIMWKKLMISCKCSASPQLCFFTDALKKREENRRAQSDHRKEVTVVYIEEALAQSKMTYSLMNGLKISIPRLGGTVTGEL
ncbi:MAG: hypothetical protein MHMPM18_001281 [Marteilia pararefringens]